MCETWQTTPGPALGGKGTTLATGLYGRCISGGTFRAFPFVGIG